MELERTLPRHSSPEKFQGEKFPQAEKKPLEEDHIALLKARIHGRENLCGTYGQCDKQEPIGVRVP